MVIAPRSLKASVRSLFVYDHGGSTNPVESFTKPQIRNILNDAEQIVGRERRERVSQLAWCGEGCFDSRRRVNSTVRRAYLQMWIRLIIAVVLLLSFVS